MKPNDWEPLIFFRAEGWYPIECNRHAAKIHAELNPGTIRVETIDGEVLWEKPPAH